MEASPVPNAMQSSHNTAGGSRTNFLGDTVCVMAFGHELEIEFEEDELEELNLRKMKFLLSWES